MSLSSGRRFGAGPGWLRRLRVALTAAVVGVCGVCFTSTAHAVTIYDVPSSIASDCSVDVTGALLSWIASRPDDSTLVFGSGQCYRIEGTLEIRNRRGLDFDGNGSTFRSFNPPDDQRAMWRAIDSSGFKFRNMQLRGSYAAGGTFTSGLQHAHGIDLRGTSAEVANVTMSDLGGDCVYFGLGYTSALTRSSGSVHDSSCTRIGRNAVSVTAANDVLVQRLTTSAVGFIAFDVEPNIGNGFGSQRITFDSNTIGSYYLYAYSIVQNALNSDQRFTNNRVVGGKGLRIGVVSPGATVRPQNVTISGNQADTATWSPAMEVHNVDTLAVSNNVVPMSGGTMASIDNSCAVNVFGNTFPGGLAEFSSSGSACSVPSPTPVVLPTVAVTAPSDGATLPTKRVTVAAKASSTAVRTEIYIDGVLKASSSTNSISMVWNLQPVARGAHTIMARAYDAGNRMVSNSITVYR